MIARTFALTALLLWLSTAAGAGISHDESSYYDAAYRAEIKPEAGVIEVELNLSGERLPSKVVLHIDPKRHRHFRSTDPLHIDGKHVTWQPRGKMSRLRYEFVVNHERAPQRYDSYMTDSWTLFRGDKLVPRARVTSRRGLQSRATLEFVLPEGWSAVTPYAPTTEHRYALDDPRHRLDRPEGWMIAGKIGVRSERIGHINAVVAAPERDGARRQDILAFLNWNLPRLTEVFPKFPRRLLIVSAGDPMWHGGLSGPASLFIHTERPLVSENRTSTLLHELVHVAIGIRGDEESDWIVEGLAEFYSIETLRRSGGIGQGRYDEAMRKLRTWARRAPTLFVDQSNGATTARAVLALQTADAEIRKLTNGAKSLDDVARELAAKRGRVSLERLQETAAQVAGKPLRSLEREQLMKPVSGPEP